MSSEPIILGIDDFETGFQGWSGGSLATSDFGYALYLSISAGAQSTQTTTSVKNIVSYLGRVPKYMTMYIKVSSTSFCSPCSVIVNFLDAGNNVISSITVISGTPSGAFIAALPVPGNTIYISITAYARNPFTTGTATISAYIDNICYFSEGSYVIRTIGAAKYNTAIVHNIPLNISGFPMMVSFLRLDSPPANVSASSESLSYTDASNNPTSTGLSPVRRDANSIVSISFSLSASVTTRVTGTIRYAIPVYRRTDGVILGLIIVYVDVNANPTQPYEITFSIPNPAFNYSTSKSATLVVVAPNLNRTSYGVKAGLSCSGDCANIVSSTVTVEYRDASNNVIYSDTATISSGSISDFTKTVNLDLGATYTVVVSITITASVTATTYLTVTLIFTAQ